MTARPPIRTRLNWLLWIDCGCFFPWRGIKDGRLGEAGGERASRPLRSRFGDKKAPDVAESTGGVSWLYAAVDWIDRFGFRLACILESFCDAWFSMSMVGVRDIQVADITVGTSGHCSAMMSAANSHPSLQVSCNRKEGTRQRRVAFGQGV